MVKKTKMMFHFFVLGRYSSPPLIWGWFGLEEFAGHIWQSNQRSSFSADYQRGGKPDTRRGRGGSSLTLDRADTDTQNPAGLGRCPSTSLSRLPLPAAAAPTVAQRPTWAHLAERLIGKSPIKVCSSTRAEWFQERIELRFFWQIDFDSVDFFLKSSFRAICTV